MIERKIRYDGSTVEINATLISQTATRMDIIHYIETPFTMKGEGYTISITTEHYTRASYWFDRPYNVYRWFDANHQLVAAYFNIVGTTSFTNNILSFEDKIIDVLVLPDGQTFVLDEDELPVPLAQFEDGAVLAATKRVLEDYKTIVFSKPLVFDLDGTICFKGQPVTPAITNTLYQLYQNGYDIIIASARPIRDIYPVLPPWMHELTMVGGNGAFIKQGAQITVTGFSCTTELTTLLDTYQLTYLADSHWDYAYTGDCTHPIFHNIDADKLASRHHSWHTLPDLAKLVIFNAPAEVVAKLSTLPIEVTAHANEALLDISPQYCTKWTGLQQLGLQPKQFIAFGNDSNDVAMFKQADTAICIGTNYVAQKHASVQLVPQDIVHYLQQLL